MKEDRARGFQRHQPQDISASDYDETKTGHQDVLIPAADLKESSPAKPSKSTELDMFAEDDDDMFATEQPSKVVNWPSKAVAIPQQLDTSLLDNWDDHEGYYKVIIGELLDGRYHVQGKLGKGVFASVVRAMDRTTQKLVAIKIIRNNETMRKAGLKEMEVVLKLQAADPEDKKHLVRLERHFDHKNHLCLVFENLNMNLRDVIKKYGREVGINLKAVRTYAHQMFLALSLLKKCNILHADLKPDNILVNEARNMLKVCDLGSAADASDADITPYLVSRFYRAPEIVLGMPYDFAIDMWSIGCTLYELYTGKILFTGRDNNELLRSIMECRGKFSNKVLKKSSFIDLYFDDHLQFKIMERDRITGKTSLRLISITKPTRDLKSRVMGNTKGMAEAEIKELGLFYDLLDKCLALNPEKRCTPMEALKHPFITRAKA